MKRTFLFSISAAALVATVPFFSNTPVLANIQDAGKSIITQALKGPEVNLNLSVYKQVERVNQEGKKEIVWIDLGQQAKVVPGDTLRYVVTSENVGDKPAKDLVITQPISPQMIYVIGSATTSNKAKITYSIDGGKTFVENPTIKVTLEDGKVEERPAPAESYTHVRWKLTDEIAGKASTMFGYKVTVK